MSNELNARLRIDTVGGPQAAAAAGQVERGVDGLGRAGTRAAGGLNQAAAASTTFERNAGGANLAARALAAGMAAIGARELVGEITDAAFALQGFETGFSAVAGGARGAQSEMAFVREESGRLGLVIRDQSKSFMELAGATDGTKLAGRETREIWLGLAEAGTALNRSNEQQQRALEAVSQIASKGVVSMEEVRGQLAEAIPGATRIAAEAMGMTSSAFIKLVSDGKLLSDDFLPKFAAELRSRFGPAVEQSLSTPLGQARKEMAETKNALFDLEAAAGEGFLTAATAGVEAFNDALADPAAQDAARRLGANLGEAFAQAASGAAFLVDNIDEVQGAVMLLAAVGLARWLSGVTQGQLNAARAAKAQAVATQEAAAASLASARAIAFKNAILPDHTARTAAITAAERQLAIATAGTTRASIAARGALTGLMGLVGGPLGLAFLATTAAVGLLTNHLAENARRAEEAAKLAGELAQSQETAAGAYDQAILFATRYGVATDGLQQALDGVLASQNQASAEALSGVGANDEAGRAAVRRAESERLLTVNILARAAAEAMARGQDARKTAQGLAGQARGTGLLTALGTNDLTMAADAEAAERKRLGVDSAYRNAEGEFRLAESLSRQQEAISRAKLTPPKDGDGDGSAAAHESVTKAAQGRRKATDEAREAEQRLARAGDLSAQAKADTQALNDRAKAAMLGIEAMEEQRVAEVALQVAQALGVESLDQLTGAQRQAADAAVEALQARERAAIAADKAERTGDALRGLDARIRSEKAKAAAIAGGIRAEVDYARAEAIRAEIERAGLDLTAEQTIAIIEKTDALFRLQAANDEADFQAQLAEELRLTKLTNQERDLEERYLRIKRSLLAEGLVLTVEELDARAKMAALAEQGAVRDATALGNLRDSVKDAFIRGGHLGFDDVADFAAQRLREQLWNDVFSKPFDMIINAVVQGLPGGGAINSALGVAALGSTLVGGKAGRTIGTSLNIATTGLAIGGALSGAGGAALAGGVGTALGGGALGAGVANGLMAVGAVAAPLALAAAAIYAAVKIFDIGGKPTNAGAGYDLRTGQISGNKRTAETEQAARGVGDGILQMEAALREGGLTLKTTVDGLVYGTRDQTQIYLSNGQTLRTAVGDATAATDAALKAVLQDATYTSDAQKKLVESMLAAGKGFDDIVTSLQSYKAAQDIGGAIDDAILQLTDPKAWGLEELRRGQKEQRDALKATLDGGLISIELFEAWGAKLANLESLQLTDALKRLGDAAGDAADGLELRKSVEDRILELTNPEAYKVKRANDDIEARFAQAIPMVQAGVLPPEFLGQIEQLRQLELANLFGELGDEVDETTKAFQDAAPRLRSWLDGLVTTEASGLSPKAQLAAAQEQFDREFAKAMAGDKTSIANITSYADRLLAADRSATSSAGDRVARYNDVTGKVATLADRGAVDASPAAAITALGIPLATIAQASAADLAAFATGGKPMMISNLPSMQAMYGGLLTTQSDRLVAANDRNAQEVVGTLKAVAEQLQGALDVLGSQIMGVQIEAALAASAEAREMISHLGELVTEQRLTEARARARW